MIYLSSLLIHRVVAERMFGKVLAIESTKLRTNIYTLYICGYIQEQDGMKGTLKTVGEEQEEDEREVKKDVDTRTYVYRCRNNCKTHMKHACLFRNNVKNKKNMNFHVRCVKTIAHNKKNNKQTSF